MKASPRNTLQALKFRRMCGADREVVTFVPDVVQSNGKAYVTEGYSWYARYTPLTVPQE